jgi:hypothetical protein
VKAFEIVRVGTLARRSQLAAWDIISAMSSCAWAHTCRRWSASPNDTCSMLRVGVPEII